jgi:hypothetical protein
MNEFDPASLDIPPDAQRRATQVEEAAGRIAALLPDATISRTRDVVQVDSGGEDGIVVIVTPETFEFRLPVIEWTCGTHGPALSSRLWKRLKHRRLSDGALARLLQEAQQARQAQSSACCLCGDQFPPGRVVYPLEARSGLSRLRLGEARRRLLTRAKRDQGRGASLQTDVTHSPGSGGRATVRRTPRIATTADHAATRGSAVVCR